MYKKKIPVPFAPGPVPYSKSNEEKEKKFFPVHVSSEPVSLPGSARIRIKNWLRDPDPHGRCGPGSGNIFNFFNFTYKDPDPGSGSESGIHMDMIWIPDPDPDPQEYLCRSKTLLLIRFDKSINKKWELVNKDSCLFCSGSGTVKNQSIKYETVDARGYCLWNSWIQYSSIQVLEVDGIQNLVCAASKNQSIKKKNFKQ